LNTDKLLSDHYDVGAAKLLEEVFNGKKDTAWWGALTVNTSFLAISLVEK
jgi:hypothetical protein